MHRNSPPGETRRRVLDVASRLFAEKGYRGATIALISKIAQVNIAAVNYHFGSKENLYQEAWRHAHQEFLAHVPPDGGVAPDQPAADRLRGRIRAGLQRAMCGEAVEFGIMRNELANPTGLLQQVIEDAIRPLRQATQAILRELLGPQATQADIELCEVCVVAPWMHIKYHSRARQHPHVGPEFCEDMLGVMEDHFTAFMLAGIGETRQRIEQSTATDRSHAASHGSGDGAGWLSVSAPWRP